jgi:hypothetical protein
MRARVLVLGMLATCLPALVQAQIRFGVSGEVNRASFGGVLPEGAEYESNYGTGFAAIVEYRVHPDVVLSFQPGWIQKGAGIVFGEDEEPDSVQTFVVEQSWMTLPVYFRIDSEGRGFYAGGGLSVDVLLESRLEHEGASRDNKEIFEEIDYVYQFLFGYRRDSGSRALFMEARYAQGMTTISSTSGTTVGDIYVAEFKSNGLRLVAGVLF